MLDIALVSRALSGPGKDAPSSLVEKAVNLVHSAELPAAAARAAEALEDGATDIRVICIYLIGCFVERGPVALAAIFETLRPAFAERWEIVRPSARKTAVAASALNLLSATLKNTLDLHEGRRDDTWRAWIADLPRDAAKQCAVQTDALARAIEKVVDDPKARQGIVSLGARVETVLAHKPAPEERPAPAPPTIEESQPKAEPETSAPSAEVPSESAPAQRMIAVSAALETFLKKIDAFELLVQRGDMQKAAIVAQDLRRIVDNFDPRVYLPALLTPYFRLLATHVDEIAPHWEGEGSPAWQALEQLYQVDLDDFVGS